MSPVSPRPISQNDTAQRMRGLYFAVRSSQHRIESYDRARQYFVCRNMTNNLASNIDYTDFMAAVDAGIIVLAVRRS